MSTRIVVVLLVVAAAAVAPAAHADGPPFPEPNAIAPVTAGPCTPDAGNPYEQDSYHADQWYGSDCHRLHFTYGPITIRPGQNDVVISPITIEKPLYDGYLTRFRPNLVRADGTVPPIEQIHLHHAVWFNIASEGSNSGSQVGPLDLRNYGDGPFFAAGEEKTIFDLPQGYGMPVKGSDQWQLLYMVHNQVATPDQVWITYDIDYVAASTSAAAGIRPAFPIWLDVLKGNFYPVFNVQRGYPAPGAQTCTWPNEQCAAFDPFGRTATGEGSPGNGVGTAWTLPGPGQPLGRVPSFEGGTLVAVGGHLHPGGLSDNIDLERSGVGRTRIFTSEAHYWDWSDPSVVGGPPTSWDLSMTATGKPRWGVRVEPGDTFWISATYDAQIQSSYEDMGIAIMFLAPDDATGIDPFTAVHDASPDCASGGLAANPPTLCERGVVTHGHMPEANDHGGQNVVPLPTTTGQTVSRIDIAGFSYLPGGQGTESTTGIPVVQYGQPLTFQNEDAAIDVYHSITSCAYPCTGATGIAYPLANGSSSAGAPIDFDSSELGYGLTVGGNSLGAAKNTWTWTLDTHALQPGVVYTFFCRIHPSMRGEFAVSQ